MNEDNTSKVSENQNTMYNVASMLYE